PNCVDPECSGSGGRELVCQHRWEHAPGLLGLGKGPCEKTLPDVAGVAVFLREQHRLTLCDIVRFAVEQVAHDESVLRLLKLVAEEAHQLKPILGRRKHDAFVQYREAHRCRALRWRSVSEKDISDSVV